MSGKRVYQDLSEIPRCHGFYARVGEVRNLEPATAVLASQVLLFAGDCDSRRDGENAGMPGLRRENRIRASHFEQAVPVPLL